MHIGHIKNIVLCCSYLVRRHLCHLQGASTKL